MIVDRILAAAAAKAAERRPARIGAHNAGKCVRHLWHVAHGIAGEPFEPRAMMVFDLGNRVEDAVLDWIHATDIGFIRPNPQRDGVYVAEIDGWVHIDFFFECELFPWAELPTTELGAVVYVPSSGVHPPQPGESLVGEIKSMSDFAFQRAQRGELDESYLAQVEVYMRAYGTRHALVIAYRKHTSHLCEVLVARNDDRWEWVKANVRRARGEVKPPRPYLLEEYCGGCEGSGKTEKRQLPHKACNGTGLERGGPYLPQFPCGYCPHKTPCWGTLELVVRDGKPRWRVTEPAEN